MTDGLKTFAYDCSYYLLIYNKNIDLVTIYQSNQSTYLIADLPTS